jgi:cell wall-associated NlpC family hydrolase
MCKNTALYYDRKLKRTIVKTNNSSFLKNGIKFALTGMISVSVSVFWFMDQPEAFSKQVNIQKSTIKLLPLEEPIVTIKPQELFNDDIINVNAQIINHNQDELPVEIVSENQRSLLIEVKKGNTLVDIFAKNNIAEFEINKFMRLSKSVKELRNLRSGQNIIITGDYSGNINELEIELNPSKILKITKDAKGDFITNYHEQKLDKKLKIATIDKVGNSLREAAQRENIPFKLILQLEKMFKSKVNFRHLQTNDSFKLVYEEYFNNNKKVKIGEVTTAKLVHNNQEFIAFNYKNNDKTSYYTVKLENINDFFTTNPIISIANALENKKKRETMLAEAKKKKIEKDKLQKLAKKEKLEKDKLKKLAKKKKSEKNKAKKLAQKKKAKKIKLAKLAEKKKKSKLSIKFDNVISGGVRSSRLLKATNQAKKYIGTRYRWGGASPRGFDCSGLVYYSMKKVGISVPRTSGQQYNRTKPVSKSKLKVGDLVFFRTTRSRRVSHVGIYVGNNKFLHAPSKNKRVTITSLNNKYYRKRFIRGGRL